MDTREKGRMTLMLALSVSFAITALTAIFLSHYFAQKQFQMLGNVCGQVMERCPDSKHVILEVLKKREAFAAVTVSENILTSFGYRSWDFLTVGPMAIGGAAVGLGAGIFLFLYRLQYGRRKMEERINMLTGYLAKINTGGKGLLWDRWEDEFSGLQDEIYKTVTMLYQTRDRALAARNNYAENLANIAHQLKTPITALSLAVQMMKEQPSADYPERMKRQLDRMTRLEESLLLLSRIDSGTLMLKRTHVDVFTVLTLASDQLQELFVQSEVNVDIPEMGGADIFVDLDWTMEAIMNLMKNCIEASEAKAVVHCAYEKNPLYVQIRIWDEGKGFAREDIMRLFERFYRGRNRKTDGIGIGLPLAKEIVEMQEGVLSAYNLMEGGACFEIRFYPPWEGLR